MTTNCNFYLDKGSDFIGNLEILGSNNAPVCVKNWKFRAVARFMFNPKIKVKIACTLQDHDNSEHNIISLFIPNVITRTMPLGTWEYEITMSYSDLPESNNRNLAVLTGKLYVDGFYR